MQSSEPEHSSSEVAAELHQLRRRNAELERELAHYRLFADSVEDYALITFNSQKRITSWNRGAERLTGYTESEVLGQSGAILFTAEDREHGEDEKELATARREGCAEDERWHLRKDGTRFWGSGVMTLLHNGEGYAKIMRDLTRHRQATEALRASEERCRLFIDNVRDHALFQLDTEGLISGWNTGAERLFGYAEEEILRQHFSVVFPAEERDRRYPEQELARTLAEGHVFDEMWLIRKDGTRFFASWVTHPIYDERGQLRGFAKVLRDETERKSAEEARQRIQQLERDLLTQRVESAGAALDQTKHELRHLAASLMTAQEDEGRRIARELHDDLAQRLASVEIQLQHLRNQSGGTGSEWTADIDSVCRDIAAMSHDVRNLSHRLHPSALDDLGLEAALRQLVQEFERTAGLEIRMSAALPLAARIPPAAATAVYRIAQEALRNVSKHAKQALVTVNVSATPEELRLMVHDDGPGFDASAARARGGLGLVTMRERAALAGGTLAVQSAPRDGTQIIVAVPLSLGG
jgi:PAS domain S-box-containing protein